MGDAIECTLGDNLGSSLRDDLDDKIEKRPCMIGSENEVLSPALTKHVLIWIVPNIPVVHSCNNVFPGRACLSLTTFALIMIGLTRSPIARLTFNYRFPSTLIDYSN